MSAWQINSSEVRGWFLRAGTSSVALLIGMRCQKSPTIRRGYRSSVIGGTAPALETGLFSIDLSLNRLAGLVTYEGSWPRINIGFPSSIHPVRYGIGKQVH